MRGVHTDGNEHDDRQSHGVLRAEFFDGFPDEGACESYLLEVRYPSGWHCPRCGGVRFGRIRCRREFQCRDCGHETSLTVGSMFENSHLPLRKWSLAIYAATHDKRVTKQVDSFFSEVAETNGRRNPRR